MSDFQWIGDSAILYHGRVCQITEHDGWGVVNASVDHEEQAEREKLKAEIKEELLGKNNK